MQARRFGSFLSPPRRGYEPVEHGHAVRVPDWPYSSFRRRVRLGTYPVNWAGEPAMERVHSAKSDGFRCEAGQEIHGWLDRRRASFETAALAASSG